MKFFLRHWFNFNFESTSCIPENVAGVQTKIFQLKDYSNCFWVYYRKKITETAAFFEYISKFRVISEMCGLLPLKLHPRAFHASTLNGKLAYLPKIICLFFIIFCIIRA